MRSVLKARWSSVVLIGLLVLVVVGTGLFVSVSWEPCAGGDHAVLSETELPESSVETGTAVSPATGSPDEVTPTFRWDLLKEIRNSPESTRYLTREQAERFLREKGATVFNLLAAASVTGDVEFARRAAKLFPEHPAVQLAMLTTKKSLAPELRAEWIARFKASSPDNPLPFICAAQDAFRRKDFGTALDEASLAVERSGLYSWTSELIDAKKQSFEVAGYYPLEAELLATFSQNMPDMFETGTDLMKLHEQALKDSDPATAGNALRAAYGLAKILQSPEGGRMLVSHTIGIGLEAFVINAVPPEVQPSFLDVPRAQRRTEMLHSMDAIKTLASIAMIPMERKDANLLADYLQRFRQEGEYPALLWLKEQIK